VGGDMSCENRPIDNTLLRFFNEKTVLVTGASGYIATNLINSLLHISCTIVRLSRHGNLLPLQGMANVIDIVGDIREIDIWRRALENIDIVYHFAGQTNVYEANDCPLTDMMSNVVPMLNLLEACRNKSVNPIIVFSGTSTEVGIPNKIPVNEKQEDVPVTIYDLHKLMAEDYLKYYARQGIVRGTTLRLANVYGPGPKSSGAGRGVMNLMIERALHGERLTIYGKGEYLRDYLYIEDVVSAFMRAAMFIHLLNGKHYVLGSGEGYKIADAIHTVADRAELVTKNDILVEHIEPPVGLSPIEDRVFVADSTAFSKATGWKARYSLIEGIDKSLSYFSRTSKTTVASMYFKEI
jgi:nucleoside-diphosphate-sugar epimerase